MRFYSNGRVAASGVYVRPNLQQQNSHSVAYDAIRENNANVASSPTSFQTTASAAPTLTKEPVYTVVNKSKKNQRSSGHDGDRQSYANLPDGQSAQIAAQQVSSPTPCHDLNNCSFAVSINEKSAH